jgi:hypothetical protein
MLAFAAAPRRGRSLGDLAATDAGRRFLRERGVFFDPAEFLDRLEAPESPALAELFGGDRDAKPVYAAQQIYADYRWSVIAKLLTLSGLGEARCVLPCVLWSDIDRCGSDGPSTGFLWPAGAGLNARFVTKRDPEREAETRFAALDRRRLREVADRLHSWLPSLPPGIDRRRRRGAQERFGPVRDILLDEHLVTLRDLNGALTAYLLQAGLGLSLRSRYVSEVLELAPFRRAVEVVISRLDAFAAAYNQGVAELLARDVDPQLRPRGPAELPLFYSTPPPGSRRLRLHHETDGQGSHYATAAEGAEVHRLALGRGRLSIDALAASGRWSPDVSLVLFLDGLVSGVVAGRSSALYGLVLNRVRERLYGRRGVPILVPDPALDPAAHGFEEDGLFYSYLFGNGPVAG